MARTKLTVTWEYGVNVRAEKSVSSPVLRVIAKGEVLNVLGEMEDGWYPVEDGFVLALDYVFEEASQPQPNKK